MEEKKKASIADTILGVFTNHDDADNAVKDLQSAGFETKDISVMMQGPKEGKALEKYPNLTLSKGVVTEAASGAAAGGIIGGLAGLLIGIVAIAVPGFGFLLFAGPLAQALGLGTAAATTLTGALAGVAGGGLIGAFSGLGVPGKEAAQYEKRLREGAVIIGVTAKPERLSEAESIMSKNNAEQIRVIPVREQ